MNTAFRPLLSITLSILLCGAYAEAAPEAKAPAETAAGTATGVTAPAAKAPKPARAAQPARKNPDAGPWNRALDQERQIQHVLNRLAFGPRPGDAEAVRQIGARAWIDAQLDAASINDQAVEERARGSFKILNLPGEMLLLAYAGDNTEILRQMRQRMRRDANNKNGAVPPAAGAQPATGGQPNSTRPTAGGQMQEGLPPRIQNLVDRLAENNLPFGTSMQAVGELVGDKLLRATDSQRQLQEVLVDFWGNHFNVDVKKGPVAVLKIVDDAGVIRPNVFGTFRSLLGASAKSPAMLFYLDNSKSTAQATTRNGKTRGGINENYARELMELHTLGVDGGYTQKDVQEVARCFTGWGFKPATGEFRFTPALHDNGAKTVLGVNIPAGGGQKDGEAVLDILANHPSTAKFIATKLCKRFVADEPPAALVDRVAAVFTRSGGDLPTIYRAIFHSREFLSEGAYRSKIKSPLEFVVSAVRALGGSYAPPDAGTLAGRARLINIGNTSLRPERVRRPKVPTLAHELVSMGEPLFSCMPPTGYPEDSRQWVSSSALVARLNFALALTAGQIADVQLTADTFRPTTVEAEGKQLLGGQISPGTRATLEKEANQGAADGARLRALILGAPEFQRR